MRYQIFFLVIIGGWITLTACDATTQSEPDLTPKVNQLGYYPEAEKYAIVPDTDANDFVIKKAEGGSVVFEGELEDAGRNIPSGEEVKVADFSAFTTPGNYVVEVNGQSSPSFEIGEDVLAPVTDGVLKAYYFMRASTPLEEAYAGKWARAAGHPDTAVMVHASAATEERPEGTIISSPKGWYDAGDYNKYVVNSGISTYTLLFAYEQFPDFFEAQDINIPESDNDLPDILDESLWNLRWLLTMQDPNDGGVYHKLTTASFEGAVMPDEATSQRYVVMKNTPATLDFAAMMAQVARVYEPFLPEFADSALAAAKEAWQWAEENPDVMYRQWDMNEEYEPDVVTGAYGDRDVSDERFWAGAELFITTGDTQYYNPDGWKEADINIPSWGGVRALGLYSLVHHRESLPEISGEDKEALVETLLELVDERVEEGETAPYRSPFGYENEDFFWGSNGHAGNVGMAILQAYQLTGDEQYYESALRVADYLLGLNPTGYSYITGFGDKPVMNIHHRPSEADGIEDPVPGLVSGGPNPNNMNQDCGEEAYPNHYPAMAFIDDWCSYSTNEITINWNAPVVYLFSGLEALHPRKPN
ncbi:glycoside hydrolase family 9 protein [Gracilimonas mengyeensis]|uniref:Endoglucanase n=1 Tax=Gracilimonas mengyeensis TaxID=1302730 RepID=A0A521F7W4_9BACT|nr:glycoside hydrolase family 9 protein [Gracilimonas mengyeensis]SMO91691.1 non-processive endocellulase [Gracilimonas mengyeensis]